MNVLQKARAHLVTLEGFLNEATWRNNRRVTRSADGVVELHNLEFQEEPPRKRSLERSISRPTSRISDRFGRLHPALAAVSSAWSSITASGKKNINYGALEAESSGIEEDESLAITVRSDVDPRLLQSASQYAQTLKTRARRFQWWGLMWASWVWGGAVRQTDPDSKYHFCSGCGHRLALLQKLFSLTMVCPVCNETFCSSCYGGSILSRLLGDRGCQRCCIIVKRYEKFHGIIACQLEMGVYCVVSVAPEKHGYERAQVTCLDCGRSADTNRALEQAANASDTLTPIGLLSASEQDDLNILVGSAAEPVIMNDDSYPSFVAARHLSFHSVSWLFLNVDAQELEFQSVQRERNVPIMHDTIRIERLQRIQASESNLSLLLYTVGEDMTIEETWLIRFAEKSQWSQWASNIRLAWELLAPERLEVARSGTVDS